MILSKSIETLEINNTAVTNKPIIATTTIGTVTVTPPTTKFAIEESCDENIVEDEEDEGEVLFGEDINIVGVVGATTTAPTKVEIPVRIPLRIPLPHRERKYYYEIQPKKVPLPTQRKQPRSYPPIGFLRMKFLKEQKGKKTYSSCWLFTNEISERTKRKTCTTTKRITINALFEQNKNTSST